MGQTTSSAGTNIDSLRAALASLEFELQTEKENYEAVYDAYKKCQAEVKQIKAELSKPRDLEQQKQTEAERKRRQLEVQRRNEAERQRFDLEEKQKQLKIDEQAAKQRQAEMLERIRLLQLEERKALEEMKAKEQTRKKAEIQHVAVGGIRQASCMREYKKLRELGKGSYGTVNQVCVGESSDCKYVMKIQAYTKGEAEREVELAKHIYTISPHITPRIYNSWLCDEKFYIVADKFDTDMQKVGERQLTSAVATGKLDPRIWPVDKFSYMFTEDQLLQMMAIMQILTLRGVVHADVKPDNFLYKNATGQVAVTDTGLTGFMNEAAATKAGFKEMIWPFHGWSGNDDFGCPPGYINRGHPWFKYLDFLNMWQLTVVLTLYPAIIDLGADVPHAQRYARFATGYLAGRGKIAVDMVKTCYPLVRNIINANLQATLGLPQYAVQKANLDIVVNRLMRV